MILLPDINVLTSKQNKTPKNNEAGIAILFLFYTQTNRALQSNIKQTGK